MEKIYDVGFALSGGFIKGFAHLGVMQALMENGIRPDIISGTSAGALAGVFVADGREPAEILELFDNKEFGHFTKFSLRSKGGFWLLDQFCDFLYDNLSVKRIEELKLPLTVTATNLDLGIAEHFTEGEIVPRVVASCCVPGMFTPVEIDGAHYIDGGVFMNLPVSPIRDACEKIVAVNVSPVLAQDYRLNVMGVLSRTYHLLSRSNSNIDRRMADILIELDNLNSYSNKELHKAKEIFDSGYAVARKVLDRVEGVTLRLL